MPRPREFSHSAVVDAAMQAFWAGGLATTSVDTLLQVTGLSRSSMYQCIGNRDTLVELAVGRYVEQQLAGIDKAFAGRALGEAFQALLEDAAQSNFDGRGCLLSNGVHELHAVEGAALAAVRDGLARVAGALGAAIERAQPGRTDSGQRSIELMIAIAGLRAMHRAGMPRSRLLDAAKRFAASLSAD
jgi:TetR/AcrR family transcriptional repressor of nem operon